MRARRPERLPEETSRVGVESGMVNARDENSLLYSAHARFFSCVVFETVATQQMR
jgi:hypothetical protein